MSIFNHHVLQTSGSLRVFLCLFNLTPRDCCFILYGRLFFDRSSSFDLCLLQSWRYPVENIDETYSTLCKIRCPVEETTKRSEEHTSELQSHSDLVCRLLLEKKKKQKKKK